MGRHYARRFVGCLLLVVVSVGVLQALIAVTVARMLGVAEPPHLAAFFFGPLVFVVVAVVIVATLARTFRSSAAPVGEIVDGLGRVAAGEQSVRVTPRGAHRVREIAEAFNTMAERLERADAQRRALLADVTHELRTPLSVIQAQLEGVLDGVYPADQAHLAPVLEQTRILARLIDDLGTLSHAEAGALSLHREPTDVRALIGRAVAPFQPAADAAGVTLAVEAGELPPVELDPVRIEEVLTNLLANALRYTPRDGRVTVTAAREGESVAIAVHDTGAGISADALPRVFDRFYKTGDSGSGLGLAIAKGLVVAHGGAIAAESAGAELGTTVRFIIPIGSSSGAAYP